MEIQRNGENKVLPSLAPFILIGSHDTISPVRCGTTSIHHCVSIGIRACSGVPEVIMRKLGDVAAHALRFNTQAIPEALILSPPHTLFILFNLECNYRAYCDEPVSFFFYSVSSPLPSSAQRT